MTREVDKMMQLRSLMKKAWIPSNFNSTIPRLSTTPTTKTQYRYKNINFIIKVINACWLASSSSEILFSNSPQIIRDIYR